jgi:hypothetical protein
MTVSVYLIATCWKMVVITVKHLCLHHFHRHPARNNCSWLGWLAAGLASPFPPPSPPLRLPEEDDLLLSEEEDLLLPDEEDLLLPEEAGGKRFSSKLQAVGLAAVWCCRQLVGGSWLVEPN